MYHQDQHFNRKPFRLNRKGFFGSKQILNYHYINIRDGEQALFRSIKNPQYLSDQKLNLDQYLKKIACSPHQIFRRFKDKIFNFSQQKSHFKQKSCKFIMQA